MNIAQSLSVRPVRMMNEDWVHERLLDWAHWTRSASVGLLGGSSHPLERLMRYGSDGAGQGGYVPADDMPDEVCEVDKAVASLPKPQRSFLKHHYLGGKPVKVLMSIYRMTESQTLDALGVARRRVGELIRK